MLLSLPFFISTLGLVSTALAWDGPGYTGFKKVWEDNFAGAAGTSPSRDKWNIIDSFLGYNSELQTYTPSSRNLQLSGGFTVQLVPWREATAKKGWTSGRIESKYAFRPAAGKITRAEARLRFGSGDIGRKQGIWPAFWLLGQSSRTGTTGWPACGEIDIMESINGQLTGYGVLHCDRYPDGVCNEPNGIGGHASIPDQSWHTWRVEFDRRSGNWRHQSITWFLDEYKFHQVMGNRIDNAYIWSTLCHEPFFFIFNVAVGGNWPGYPNDNTDDGYRSMLEVGYVAHYEQF